MMINFLTESYATTHTLIHVRNETKIVYYLF